MCHGLEVPVSTEIAILTKSVKKYRTILTICAILTVVFQLDVYFLFYGKKSREKCREKRYSPIVSDGSLCTILLGGSI